MDSRYLLSETIAGRMKDLGLTTNQVSVAARVHKTTLYRILNGSSQDPRPATLRRLARALGLPLVELTNQIELPGLTSHYDLDHPLQALLRKQLGLVREELRSEAMRAALGAIVDVHMAVDPKVSVDHQDAPSEDNVLEAYQAVPRLLQRTAVREAIRTVLDVQLRDGTEPSEELYAAAGSRHLQSSPGSFHRPRLFHGVRHRAWAKARMKPWSNS